MMELAFSITLVRLGPLYIESELHVKGVKIDYRANAGIRGRAGER